MPDTLTLEATNVTGTQEVPVKVQSKLPASAVARTIASRMSMPDNVPWALRDDSSSAYLEDDKPIGDQVVPGTRVTLTPKTHLG